MKNYEKPELAVVEIDLSSPILLLQTSVIIPEDDYPYIDDDRTNDLVF